MFGIQKAKADLEIQRLKLEIEAMRSLIDSLEQKFKTLRGLVYRKIGYDDKEENKPKDIYNGMLVPV